MNRLTCRPQSSRSWDYILTDPAQRESAVFINYFTEQGSIVHESAEYVIVKEGWFRNRWSFNRSSQCTAHVVASGALQRRFRILTPGKEYELRPRHLLTREFDIYATPTPIGWIVPAHAFTREATLECTSEMPTLLQVLCFWLAAISWRRYVRNNLAWLDS